MHLTDRHREYWRRNLRLTGALLVIWFFVGFLTVWYARELNGIEFIGPLGFYMGAQGSLLIYLAIIGYYSKRMDALDKQFGVEEEED